MKKYIVITILLSSLLSVKADEGMWLLQYLEQLNVETMNEMGCGLTADQIYSVNNNSLKDAIVIFGGGCTAEIVSDKGLIFTNHHCGFDYIQNNSTVEHDYLTNGFWAKNHEEELKNPDLEVRFLTRIEDVTYKIDSALSDTMTVKERKDAIKEIQDYLIENAPDDSTHEVLVEPFFNGNQYLLIVYQIFKDVRLVGTPPASVGKFGGDTDNWMWPRHTGDFSVFRVYTAPDGSPAEYSEENIPMQTDNYLRVTLDGVEENDFTFILGFPGSTERYVTSYHLRNTVDIVNQNRIDIRKIRLDILDEKMGASDEVRIKYASKHARSANYYKYSIGQNRGVQRLDVFEKKTALENKFQDWANESAERKKEYGNVLNCLDSAYAVRAPYLNHKQYIYESFYYSADFIGLARKVKNLHKLMEDEKTSDEELAEEIETLRDEADKHFAEYDFETDKAVAIALTANYYNKIHKSRQPGKISAYGAKNDGDFTKFYDKIFAKSILTDQDRFMVFLEKPSVKTLKKDPGYRLYSKFANVLKRISSASAGVLDEIDNNNRLFLKGLREMDSTLVPYPDANFTMRLTYGQVQSYKPFDAGFYDYYTTEQGILEKEDPNSDEFCVPEKLIGLLKEKDFGPYGDSSLTVCFITNNDITGGNSGSPTLNSKGQLIGLAFDGNWEAMSGDIIFEPEIQRCIVVDIRYVLFIIDKFAGAGYIIDELTIE